MRFGTKMILLDFGHGGIRYWFILTGEGIHHIDV